MNGLFSLGFPSPVEDSQVSLRIPGHAGPEPGSGQVSRYGTPSGSWQRCASGGLLSPWYTGQASCCQVPRPVLSASVSIHEMVTSCVCFSPQGDQARCTLTGLMSTQVKNTQAQGQLQRAGSAHWEIKGYLNLEGEYRQSRVNVHHWLGPRCQG